MAINFFTRKEYNGVNAAVLGDNEYATFLQWNKGGYKVKKGSKHTRIIKVVETKDKNGKSKRGVRFYKVFSREQVEKVA